MGISQQKREIKNGDKSFSKLFDIIEEIAQSRSGLKGREIAEKTGLPVSTTFRMLKFLVENGYLRSAASTYTLGLGIARLGNIAASQNPLLKISRPLLAELSAKTMETVHLAELKDHQIRYVEKVEGVRSVRMGSLIGNYSPLFCTGIGKAILAFLPPEKSNGRSIRGQLSEPSLPCSMTFRKSASEAMRWIIVNTKSVFTALPLQFWTIPDTPSRESASPVRNSI